MLTVGIWAAEHVIQIEPSLIVATQADQLACCYEFDGGPMAKHTGHGDFKTTKFHHLNVCESLGKATACSYSLK